jgi:DNA polymerase
VPLKFYGAHTGRWAGAAGLNFLNFRKEPLILNDRRELIEDTATLCRIFEQKEETGQWPKDVLAAIDVRKILIPRAGRKFILADESQIEPRVLAWLAKDKEFLEQIGKGISPYEAHARATMGWTGGDLKTENKGLYHLAKCRVLGLGYGCGWRKFITLAYALARLRLTEEDSRRYVREFREQNTRITRLWDTFGKALLCAANNRDNMEIELPSGRKMCYRGPRREARMRLNQDTQQVERTTVVTADIGGIRKEFYGGKVTENVTQAVARDVFSEHLLALRKSGRRAIFHVYDEVILEVPPDDDPKEVERLMSQTPAWLPGCPVTAEAQIADHYRK